MPASQLASTPQPSSQRAAAAQPKNGAKKLISPTAVASFHLRRNTSGSSSAPARKVSTLAPVPESNLIHPWSPPSTAVPTSAPMSSCAMVPTTISESAVATRSQIDTSVAMSASPSQSAASAQVSVTDQSRQNGISSSMSSNLPAGFFAAGLASAAFPSAALPSVAVALAPYPAGSRGSPEPARGPSICMTSPRI